MVLQPKQTQNHTGRYRRAWLDHLFGEDGYSVYSLKVDNDFAKEREIENLIRNIRSENSLTLINQTDDNFTCLLVHDEEKQGWMKALEEHGVEIVASPKTPKRITALTRHVYLAVVRDFRDGDEEIPVVMVEPDTFSDHKQGDKVSFFNDPVDRSVTRRTTLSATQAAMFLDGGSVISKEILEEMICNGARFIERNLHNPYDTVINQKYDNAYSGQIRLVGPDGQIKGDTLVATREEMARALKNAGIPLPECGYVDVISTADNLKHEVRWTKGQYLVFEPHPIKGGSDAQRGKTHQYTDQQYLTWMHDWLFTSNELLMHLHEYVNHVVDKLQRGEIPAYFRSTGKLEDPTSSIERFQYTSLMYDRHGLGILSSVSLLKRIMNGAIKQLVKDRSDPKFPIPCSMYAHVATDSWLRACGRDPKDWPNGEGQTPRGYIWYDEKTDRMVYNDLDFVEDYDRHGGFDLDDAVKYFARTWRGTRVWVAVRSPNTYGEYSIRRHIQGTYAPVWQIDDHAPIEFPEIPDERLPFCGEIDVTYEFDDMNFNFSKGDMEFDKEWVIKRVINASRFRGLFGRYVNLDMVYHGTFNGPQLEQLAPLEEVVDASTQNPSEEARELIARNVDERAKWFETMSFQQEIPIDEQLWDKRGDKRRSPKLVVSWFSTLNDNARSINSQAVLKIRTFSQEAVKEIPEILHKLGDKERSTARKFIELAYKNMAGRGTIVRLEDEKNAEFHGRINDLLVEGLKRVARNEYQLRDIVIAMASECYSNLRGRQEYNDTLLFYQSNYTSGDSMFNFFLDALNYYGIKEWRDDPDGWIDDFHCHSCDVTTLVTDPLIKQQLGYEPCQHVAEIEESSS